MLPHLAAITSLMVLLTFLLCNLTYDGDNVAGFFLKFPLLVSSTCLSDVVAGKGKRLLLSCLSFPVVVIAGSLHEHHIYMVRRHLALNL